MKRVLLSWLAYSVPWLNSYLILHSRTSVSASPTAWRIWWQRLHTSLTKDPGRHICHTSPTRFLLAALVNIKTPPFILNTAGSNMERTTKTYLALLLVSAFSGNCPFSTQLIISLQTSSLDCSFVISIRLCCCIFGISFSCPLTLITGLSIL